MRNIILYSLLLLAVSNSAFAEDYYWTVNTTGLSGIRYKSAVEACKASFTQRKSDPTNGSRYAEPVEARIVSTGRSASCTWAFPPNYPNGGWPGATATRAGTSCTLPEIYNAATGGCENPNNKCASRAGQQRTFQKKGTIGDGWFSVTGNGFGVHPQDNCVEGCQAWTEGVKCKYNNLIGNVYLCRGTANLTGAECGTSGADAEETDDKTLPEPDRIVDKKPCVYKTNSDGTQTCQSESSDYQDGQHCGEVNGVRKCLDKAPEKNGIDIRTDIKTEPTSDGGSKTTKTDVTTKTECKNGKCSTSTTTRTTTTTKDANGKTSSVSGTCTGKDCKEKNEDPDGNGNGTGNCTGKDCGDDPFDEGMGEGGFYEPGTDTFESVLTTFQTGVKSIPVVQGAGNFLAFNPTGSCPSGSVTVMGMPVQLDQWCGSTIPWDLIKSVIMAVAAFLAYRIAFL